VDRKVGPKPDVGRESRKKRGGEIGKTETTLSGRNGEEAGEGSYVFVPGACCD